MEDLTRSQFIMLVVLVSFVTSIFTGIVVATLVSQAPSPITQTVSRVIEKTIETISMSPSEIEGLAEPRVVIVNQEDLIVKIVEDTSSAVVGVVASKDIPIIEQYFINPFENDEFFKKFFPNSIFPEMKVPQYRQNGTEKKQVSSGTGFFVSKDGFVLTNKHVVADTDAEYSIIMNDGSKLEATVLARDPFQDIAILKVDGQDFNYIPFANSDKIKVGQTCIAIGNTLGELQNTVSVGIISGLDRTVVASGPSGTKEQLQKIIQTDAAISSGNSGGPLLDLKGKVVGINTAVAVGAENVGFALPINIAKKHINDVKEFGEIKFAYLGVNYTLRADDYGVLIIKGNNGESAIIENSPAEKAGLKEGDIILEFNDNKINKDNTLGEFLNGSRVGQEIILKVLRNEEEIKMVITLDEIPKSL